MTSGYFSTLSFSMLRLTHLIKKKYIYVYKHINVPTKSSNDIDDLRCNKIFYIFIIKR